MFTLKFDGYRSAPGDEGRTEHRTSDSSVGRGVVSFSRARLCAMKAPESAESGETKWLAHAYPPPVWTTILAVSFAQYGPHVDLGVRYTAPGGTNFEKDKTRQGKTKPDKTRKHKANQAQAHCAAS